MLVYRSVPTILSLEKPKLKRQITPTTSNPSIFQKSSEEKKTHRCFDVKMPSSE